MSRFKKIFPIMFAALLCILPLIGCDCDGLGDRTSLTPEQEYVRVRSLAGDGVSFDFSEHPTFSASAVATMSGGKIATPIEMSSLYSHDFRSEPFRSYSHAKFVNSVTEQGGEFEPYYDEYEYGFQTGASGDYRYLESMKSYDGLWQIPGEYGNGSYSDTLSGGVVKTADRMTHNGSRLPDENILEAFRGEMSGGIYFVGAQVKSDKISEFAQWLDGFLPLMSLKDPSGEFRFFDLSDPAKCRASIEIKSTSKMLNEVAVSFTVPSNGHGGDLGVFEFSARMTFTSGGVSVKRLSYFDRENG